MSGRFEGKCLLATGAGSGLARATVERFTADGGRVAVLDLDGDRARAVAGELPGSVAFAVDVADGEDQRRSGARALHRDPHLDRVQVGRAVARVNVPLLSL